MGATVSTPSGKLRGLQLPGCLSFMGVPFAAPPTGEGRFRPPRSLPPWSGERDATARGHVAPQPPGVLGDLSEMSEDCLQLNVWTPSTEGRHPVLLFLHGGGFTTGAGSQGLYDGAALASRFGIAVVTANYRLGALGFLHLRSTLSPSLDVEDNLALRDQLHALSWVATHIEAFGGDPTRVTLGGQSAGAMCGATLLSTGALGDRCHRAILQSGALAHCMAADDAAPVAEAFLEALGGSPARAESLWSASVAQLLEAQRAVLRVAVTRGRPGRPVPERVAPFLPLADGRLVPHDPVEAMREGRGSSIPLIVGANRDEWNLYLYLSDTGKLGIDEDGLRKVIARRIPPHGEAAVDHYLQTHFGSECTDHAALFSRIEGDRNFRFPAWQLADAHARQVGQTFLYDFCHPTAMADGRMAAYHGAEIPFVFGGTDSELGRAMVGEGPSVAGCSERMMVAWTRFVAGEAPDLPDGAWAPYEPSTRRVLELGEQVRTLEAPWEQTRRFWDARL